MLCGSGGAAARVISALGVNTHEIVQIVMVCTFT